MALVEARDVILPKVTESGAEQQFIYWSGHGLEKS